MTQRTPPVDGFATFVVIWAGQLASLLGTGLTRFALILWLYEQTGQATSIALLGFFSFGIDNGPQVCSHFAE